MNAPVTPPPGAVRTTCPYCGVGCGVLAAPDGRGGAGIQGDPDHPANFGRLCSKGSALGETLSLEGRLLYPEAKGADGRRHRVSWENAFARVAEGFQTAIARHGPDSVAFYVSGQLLTEDYYVANKLMKGFIGSANIDTNSRLCMASSVAGHKRAFGSDTVPGCYEDLDQADLLVLVGSNAAWCHPVLYQRMQKNREQRGARLVVIDPRATPTAEDCDLFLPIAPGMDAALFSGLFSHLAANGILDRAFVSDHTDGFAEALARARHIAPDIAATARTCGLDPPRVEQFFAWFTGTTKTVTLYSQGVNQSAQGTDKVNAIINCHLATARIGHPGMGPFSLTGQPNAMGGREVGGMANQLAAHMGFEAASVDRVRRFWKAPHMATREGLKAVDMFDAVAAGRIKALWIMATNPAVSLPRADAVRAALGNLDFLAVSEVMASTDSLGAEVDVALPAAAWGEKDGTVTNSERRISRQRMFMAPAGEAQADWWIVSEVARRMGYADAFAYTSAADVFREHAALSLFDNTGARDFDLGAFADVSRLDYAMLAPTQWPIDRTARSGTQRLFSDGRFFTANRKARFVAVEPPRLSTTPDRQFPLILNTGRVRDHWHTMSRTGKSPRLGSHIVEPFVDVHPDDAARYGLVDSGLARLTSAHGSAVVRVRVSAGQSVGMVFAPIHWNGETASDARVGALVRGVCDPVSGQPELKATPASIAPVMFAVEGFAFMRDWRQPPAGAWWARATVANGTGIRFAADTHPEAWITWSESIMGGPATIEFEDRAAGLYRAARIEDDRLVACVFLATRRDALPDWDWVKRQFEAPSLDAPVRRALLSGRSVEGSTGSGPIICACFGVGLGEISAALRTTASVDGISRQLKAGTNCGSCLPELRRIVARHVQPALPVGAA